MRAAKGSERENEGEVMEMRRSERKTREGEQTKIAARNIVHFTAYASF